MAENELDDGKRRFLITATTVAASGAAAAAAAVPFVASMLPSERAKAAGAPVEVDVSRLEPGQRMIVEWRGETGRGGPPPPPHVKPPPGGGGPAPRPPSRPQPP